MGIKSRGIYETPAGTLLREVHLDLEGLCLDKEVCVVKFDKSTATAVSRVLLSLFLHLSWKVGILAIYSSRIAVAWLAVCGSFAVFALQKNEAKNKIYILLLLFYHVKANVT